jgi:hypothetical protein
VACESFTIPGSRTHEPANNIVQFARSHTRPLSKEDYHSILPSIQALNQELSHAQVDRITRNENGRADYEIAAQNAVQHAVRISREGNEGELYQFTPGRRSTRAHAAQSPFDPLSIAYVEEHGLGPAAEEFSQEPIDALAKIEERLGNNPSPEQASNLLSKHHLTLDAKRLADEELTKYRNYSREVMRQLKEQRSASKSTASQRAELPDVTQTEEYNKLVDPHQEKLIKVRNRYLALEEQEDRIAKQIGPARSEDIISGSPVTKARDALILKTVARYQVLLNTNPHLFFAKKIDNAIAEHDIAWEDEQRTSLKEDGHEGDNLEKMLARIIRYRQVGLENLQITDSIRDSMENIQKSISDELGKTRDTVVFELNEQASRYEMALEKISQQLGVNIEDAANLITKSIEKAGQSISESVDQAGQLVSERVDYAARSVSGTVEDVADKIMENMKTLGNSTSKVMKNGNNQIKEQMIIGINALNDQKKLLTQIYDAAKNSLSQKGGKNITSGATGYFKGAAIGAAKSAMGGAAAQAGHGLAQVGMNALATAGFSCSVM